MTAFQSSVTTLLTVATNVIIFILQCNCLLERLFCWNLTPKKSIILVLTHRMDNYVGLIRNCWNDFSYQTHGGCKQGRSRWSKVIEKFSKTIARDFASMVLQRFSPHHEWKIYLNIYLLGPWLYGFWKCDSNKCLTQFRSCLLPCVCIGDLSKHGFIVRIFIFNKKNDDYLQVWYLWMRVPMWKEVIFGMLIDDIAGIE